MWVYIASSLSDISILWMGYCQNTTLNPAPHLQAPNHEEPKGVWGRGEGVGDCPDLPLMTMAPLHRVKRVHGSVWTVWGLGV